MKKSMQELVDEIFSFESNNPPIYTIMEIDENGDLTRSEFIFDTDDGVEIPTMIASDNFQVVCKLVEKLRKEGDTVEIYELGQLSARKIKF